MMNYKKRAAWILGGIFAVYILFIAKKTFWDEGYPSEKDEKEVLLGYYVVMLGLENTQGNRDKYRSMTIPELKKELRFDYEPDTQ